MSGEKKKEKWEKGGWLKITFRVRGVDSDEQDQISQEDNEESKSEESWGGWRKMLDEKTGGGEAFWLEMI